jgi:RNA polymerase sigma factor (sigma-70 family)
MSDQPDGPGAPTASVEDTGSPQHSDGSRGDDWSKTRLSLLEGLRDRRNHEAWEKFVDRYGPRVIQWARAWFYPSDAEDVAQMVFLKLVPAMETFVYQPGKKFRSYLKTVTHHAMVDLSRQRGRQLRAKGGGDIQEALLREEARVDLEARLAAEYDLELLEEAEQRVLLHRVKDPRRWTAYLEADRHGRPPEEIARELGIPVAKVYSASWDIKQMIREEIAKMGGPD